MAKFKRQHSEDWIEKAKEMENTCNEKVKNLISSYKSNPALIMDALQFGSKFYSYSPKNMQLIYAQSRGAQYVQSFVEWKNMGYSVKKNEVGLKIWVPVKTTFLNINDNYVKLSDATKEQKNDFKKGKLEGMVSTRFKLGTVFDIGQTTFPPEQYPELFSVGYPSQFHNDITKGLEDYAKEYVHFDVSMEDLSSISLRGYCSPGQQQIVINSSLKDTQKLSTMSHELGHAIRHGLDDGLTGARREFEADSLSLMVDAGFGLNTTISRKEHFIQHYNEFKTELQEELGEEYTDQVLDEKIDEVISSVYGTYADCIEDINLCVERYVPQERMLEYEQQKKALRTDIQQEHVIKLDQQQIQEKNIILEQEQEQMEIS